MSGAIDRRSQFAYSLNAYRHPGFERISGPLSESWAAVLAGRCPLHPAVSLERWEKGWRRDGAFSATGPPYLVCSASGFAFQAQAEDPRFLVSLVVDL